MGIMTIPGIGADPVVGDIILISSVTVKNGTISTGMRKNGITICAAVTR